MTDIGIMTTQKHYKLNNTFIIGAKKTEKENKKEDLKENKKNPKEIKKQNKEWRNKKN